MMDRPDPALDSEPMIRYTVTGPNAVFGHEPGSTFEAAISEEQERQLVEGGHLAVQDDANPPPQGDRSAIPTEQE